MGCEEKLAALDKKAEALGVWEDPMDRLGTNCEESLERMRNRLKNTRAVYDTVPYAREIITTPEWNDALRNTAQAGEFLGDLEQAYPRSAKAVKALASAVSPTFRNLKGAAHLAGKQMDWMHKRWSGNRSSRRKTGGRRRRQRKIHTGPRGGRFYVTKGRKVYVS